MTGIGKVKEVKNKSSKLAASIMYSSESKRNVNLLFFVDDICCRY